MAHRGLRVRSRGAGGRRKGGIQPSLLAAAAWACALLAAWVHVPGAAGDVVLLGPPHLANATLVTFHGSWHFAEELEQQLPSRVNLTFLTHPRLSAALQALARFGAANQHADGEAMAAVERALRTPDGVLVILSDDVLCCMEDLSALVGSRGAAVGVIQARTSLPFGDFRDAALDYFQSCRGAAGVAGMRLVPQLLAPCFAPACAPETLVSYALGALPSGSSAAGAAEPLRAPVVLAALALNRPGRWRTFFGGPAVVGTLRVFVPVAAALIGMACLLALLRRRRSSDGAVVLALLHPRPWHGARFAELMLLIQAPLSFTQAALLAVTGVYASPTPLALQQFALFGPAMMSVTSSALMAVLFKSVVEAKAGATASAVGMVRRHWSQLTAAVTFQLLMAVFTGLLGTFSAPVGLLTVLFSASALIVSMVCVVGPIVLTAWRARSTMRATVQFSRKLVLVAPAAAPGAGSLRGGRPPSGHVLASPNARSLAGGGPRASASNLAAEQEASLARFSLGACVLVGSNLLMFVWMPIVATLGLHIKETWGYLLFVLLSHVGALGVGVALLIFFATPRSMPHIAAALRSPAGLSRSNTLSTTVGVSNASASDPAAGGAARVVIPPPPTAAAATTTTGSRRRREAG